MVIVTWRVCIAVVHDKHFVFGVMRLLPNTRMRATQLGTAVPAKISPFSNSTGQKFALVRCSSSTQSRHKSRDTQFCAKNSRWFSDGDYQRLSHEHGADSQVYCLVTQPGEVAIGDIPICRQVEDSVIKRKLKKLDTLLTIYCDFLPQWIMICIFIMSIFNIAFRFIKQFERLSFLHLHL